MNWRDAFASLNGVRDELEAARLAIAHTQMGIRNGQALTIRVAGFRPSHFGECAGNLERTYVLRLFAEFEGIVRTYWALARPRPRRRRTPMEILLDRSALSCRMPVDVLEDAHDVRRYRNSLIHDDHEDNAAIAVLDFHECKSRLAAFVRSLPLRW
jgi:hypothetical protein